MISCHKDKTTFTVITYCEYTLKSEKASSKSILNVLKDTETIKVLKLDFMLTVTGRISLRNLLKI